MASTKSLTHFWTDEETRFLLNQVQEQNILKFMDGRKTRNADLFKRISSKMAEAGFARTPEQIRVKWKSIRKAYRVTKENNSRSGRDRTSCPYYELMDELLGSRPLSQAGQHGVDIGFEAVDQETVETTEMGEETIMEESTISSDIDETTRQLEDDPPRSTESSRSISPLPGTSSAQQHRRRRHRNSDVALICQEMEENRAFWRQQMRESDERQERLLTNVMAGSNTASNNMMAALLEGLKSLRQPAPPSHIPQHTNSAPQPGAYSGYHHAFPGPSSPVCSPRTPPHIQQHNSTPQPDAYSGYHHAFSGPTSPVYRRL